MTLREINLENAQQVVIGFLTEQERDATNDRRGEKPTDSGTYSPAFTVASDMADLIGTILAQPDSLLRKPNSRIIEAFEEANTGGCHERQSALNTFLTEISLNDLLGFDDPTLERLGERFEEAFDHAAEFPTEAQRAHEIGIRYVMQLKKIDRIKAETELQRVMVHFTSTHKHAPNAAELIAAITQYLK